MLKTGLIVVMVVAFLAGCSSHRTSMYNINGEEVFLGWNDQHKLPADAFYVLIEGNKEDTAWTVKEIYNHPIKGRSNELQEVLFVDRAFRYVQPYFEIAPSTVVSWNDETKVNYKVGPAANGGLTTTGMVVERKDNYLDRGSWECGAVMQKDKDKYTPCTSRLTKTDIARSIGKNIFAIALTAGLASGTHQVVDKEKLSTIITQTDLFEQIKRSGLYSQASGQ